MSTPDLPTQGPEAPAPPLDGGPGSPAFVADPYAFYTALRARAPVYAEGDQGVFWLLTHAAVSMALQDRRFGKRPPAGAERPLRRSLATEASSDQPVARTVEEALGLPQLPPSMLFLDPPEHTRLRSLVNLAFTPRMVERLRPRVAAIAQELLGAMEGGEVVDLVSAYAFPLPAIVIAELLGVPSADRSQFRAWSEDIALSLDGTQPEEVRRRGETAARSLATYFAGLLAERRRAPREDLLTALLAAEEQGDRLGPADLLSMCILLLVAGHETTKNLIANGVLTLLRHPDQLARLRADPSLYATAVEELLRFESPVQRTARITHADVDVDGVRIPRGALVLTVIGSANRDPEVFADPDHLDLGRAENPHLAFGRGIHFCLGAPLARLEGQVALQALLDRFPRLALAEDTVPEWSTNTVIRGLRTLPVAPRGA
jgi:pimeloyl-[acyl-carrier protein] synthase